MKKETENWILSAKYELKVAQDNLKLANYLTSIEKCHVALEKLLKGIITENNHKPKKIHDLLILASDALITNLQTDIETIFDELNDLYFHTRYPDEFVEMEQEISKPKAEELMQKTKEVFKWLEEKVK